MSSILALLRAGGTEAGVPLFLLTTDQGRQSHDIGLVSEELSEQQVERGCRLASFQRGGAEFSGARPFDALKQHIGCSTDYDWQTSPPRV